MKKVIYSLFQLLLILQINLAAQVQFPIQPILQINAPTSTYLTDYTAPGSNRFQLNLFQNDFNEPSFDVRLQISIEGNGVNLTTKPNWIPPAITLQPGGNIFLGNDIESYFNPNNMIVNGLNPDDLLQNGSGLPEGLYSICVKVFDYLRPDVALSEEVCFMQALFKNYPPILVFPACGSTAPVTDGSQNILFNWQSNSDMSIQAEYELTVVEVPEGMNPNDAINGAQTPILDAEVIMMATTFNYDISQLPLEIGTRYVYRIQVKDAFGLTTFENNGYSEVCTFDYGFNASGPVELILPETFESFGVNDQVNLTWSRPIDAQPSQNIFYEIKIVEMLPNQSPENAVAFNTTWHETVTPVIPAGGSYVLPMSPLPGEKALAWQVKAMSDASGVQQQMGISEARVFYTRPLVDLMKGGNPDVNWFEILGLTKMEDVPGTPRKKISGSARVKIKADGEEMIVQFTDIIVEPVSNYYQIVVGEIRNSVSNFNIDLDNSGLSSDDFDYNGDAQLEVTEVIFTKDDLLLNGRIKWAYPQATTSAAAAAFVQSELTEFFYNQYLLTNTNVGVEEKSFDMLIPNGFKVNFFPSANSDSKFSVTNNVLTMNLNGEILTPQTVQGINNQPIGYHFHDVDNPYYWTMTDIAADANVRIINGTTLQIDPQTIIFDMSEEESPAAIPADWLGLYFSVFKTVFPTDFDLHNEFILETEQIYDFDLSTDSNLKAWIDGNGLQCKLDKTYTGNTGPKGTFNTFRDYLTSWNIEITDNNLVSGDIQGEIFVPFISATEHFLHISPFDNNGLQSGYLDTSITGTETVINDNLPKNRIVITIQQAVFANKERLDLSVSMDWEELDAAIDNLTQFSIWGNGEVGFSAPNGRKTLPVQAQGQHANKYEVTVEKVGIGKNGTDYWVTYEGNINLGVDVSGIVGPPDIILPSIDPDKLLNALTIEGGLELVDQVLNASIDDVLDPFIGDHKFRTDPGLEGDVNMMVDFNIDLMVLKAAGKMYTFHDHPEWGDGFYGALMGEILDAGAGVEMMIGETNGYKYWLADVEISLDKNIVRDKVKAKLTGSGGQDLNKFKKGNNPDIPKKTVGVQKAKHKNAGSVLMVMGEVGLTSIRGRFYHNMREQIDVEWIMDTDYNNIENMENRSVVYVPDNSIAYGAAFGAGIVDMKTVGVLFKGKGLVELGLNSGGGKEIFKIETEALFGNLNVPGLLDVSLLKTYGYFYHTFATETTVGFIKAKSTVPLICGGGALNFSFGPNESRFNLGSQQFPIQGLGPCFLPSIKGVFNYDKSANGTTEVDASMYLGINMSVTGPWIPLSPFAKFQPYVNFGFEMGAIGKIQLAPTIAAGSLTAIVGAHFSAGVNYWVGLEVCYLVDCSTITLHEGNFVFGSLYFNGNLTLNPNSNPVNVVGTVSGGMSIPFIGNLPVSVPVNLNF